MKLEICGKEYESVGLSTQKYKKLISAMEEIGNKNFFENPFEEKELRKMAEIISDATDGKADVEKIMDEGDVVEIVIAFNRIQADVNIRWGKAIEAMKSDFFTGAEGQESSAQTS
ncbi:MAG: hypothetical protein VB030_02875 [Eubacterium aggregans]|uniref:hypothetical protein n=1 Tax=Eubacterium aggregans TaxID=81409 RepID=UPI002B20B765|nr:hypothetical protein [Eubacterium aggregans]MEA5073095.1 hypothetical protein [Eubacterium aggregans]